MTETTSLLGDMSGATLVAMVWIGGSMWGLFSLSLGDWLWPRVLWKFFAKGIRSE